MSVVHLPCTPEERARVAAGSEAFNRAVRLGYSLTTARALRRTAQREWVLGEAPTETAVRIVRRPHESSTGETA